MYFLVCLAFTECNHFFGEPSTPLFVGTRRAADSLFITPFSAFLTYYYFLFNYGWMPR